MRSIFRLPVLRPDAGDFLEDPGGIYRVVLFPGFVGGDNTCRADRQFVEQVVLRSAVCPMKVLRVTNGLPELLVGLPEKTQGADVRFFQHSLRGQFDDNSFDARFGRARPLEQIEHGGR
jgi:hypothetical protein